MEDPLTAVLPCGLARLKMHQILAHERRDVEDGAFEAAPVLHRCDGREILGYRLDDFLRTRPQRRWHFQQPRKAVWAFGYVAPLAGDGSVDLPNASGIRHARIDRHHFVIKSEGKRLQ
jgi:hypothetical protein